MLSCLKFWIKIQKKHLKNLDYFKRNDFMTKLEVEDTIKELVSKYLKLYEKTAN